MDRITGWVAEHHGIALTDLRAVEAGADRGAELFRGTDGAGSGYAVKWTANESAAGLVIPEALGALAPGTVADVVPTHDGGLWADVGGRRLSVTRWVTGAPALGGPLRREQWTAYGRLLARLHRLPVDDGLQAAVPAERYDPGRWVRAFDDADRAVTGVGPGADDIQHRLAEGWTAGRDRLFEVRDRAVALAGVLRRRADLPAPVPCHADPHLGNVIVTGDTRVVLIDFDDAVLAPPERDLMFVLGGGVLPFAPATTVQQAWFLDGYGGVDPDPQLLTYYRCTRALEDVAELALVALDATLDLPERAENLGYVEGVLGPYGLLAQALSGR
ncbi:aminoglycoside phosphotransferase family protein [Polymorphospora rubra]|uniref:aminoglycoside phosphotransferase family protein n=1 Tax=Polymorphospora rubra TaxID=338584 RepID=UPI0033F590A9